MKNLVISYFFALLIFTKPTWADNFIFDLDGVIVGTDSRACLKYMKLSNIIKSIILQNISPANINKHIKHKFTEILTKVSELHSIGYEPGGYAYDSNNEVYSAIFCAWLNGALSNEEVRTLVLSSINQHPEWFAHRVEQEIISNIMSMLFTPEHFVATRVVYKDALDFINYQRRNGHKIYILSNWDTESYMLLKDKYPEIFEFVDGVIISGKVGALKPSPLIYEMLLERFDLDPKNSWFIDDQQENIKTACRLGIKGILCEHRGLRRKPDFRRIGKRIKN